MENMRAEIIVEDWGLINYADGLERQKSARKVLLRARGTI